MWPLEAICLPTLWLNRVGMSIHRVVPVSEFSNTFCQFFFLKKISFCKNLKPLSPEDKLCNLSVWVEPYGSAFPASQGWELWLLLVMEAGRANGFSSALCVCGSGSLGFCRNWCSSVLRKGLWSHFLLWKVIMVGWTVWYGWEFCFWRWGNITFLSVDWGTCAYDLSF